MPKKVTRLFNQFRPKLYRIKLDLDTANMSFVGRVTISGKKIGRPSRRLTLHQKNLKVSAATVTREDKKGSHSIKLDRINHHRAYDEVRLHATEAMYPGNYVVTLDFTGNIQSGMHGIYRSNYQLDGKQKAIISTQFESHHAREAFPCIDEPEAKAVFELILHSPEAEAVLSNTPVASQTKKNGQLVTKFEKTPRMSTYLLAFACGDLQSKEATTKDGVVVRAWSTKAHALEALDFPLDVIKRGVEFFNEYYGVPYPLQKLDNIAIPDFSAGAMENWGLITYREQAMLADPQTTTQNSRESIATTIIHELSHQWFGNLVTMRWWNDLWLNESFAKVMEFVGTDPLFPDWSMWDDFIAHEGLSALRRDSIDGVQAVKTSVNHPDEIATLFDPSIVYAKGGRLINMLRQYLGDDDFRAGLKKYFHEHALANTTGDDLWRSLQEASGKDVKGLMDPWITQPGFPVVRVKQDGVNLQLSQSRFLLNPDNVQNTHVWPVPLLSANPGVPQLLSSKQTEVTLPSDEFVRINAGAVGHYIVQYVEPAHLAAIAKLAASKQLVSYERLMLLSDSAMLARGQQQSFAETLKLLEHYAGEDRDPVWSMIAMVIGDLRRFIPVDNKLEEPVKSLVNGLISQQFTRLGWEEKAGESANDTKLRTLILSLGVYAEDALITKTAKSLFADYKKDAKSVSPNLRGVVLGTAIRTDSPGAFEYLLKLDDSTSNIDLKQDIMSALTLTKAPGQVGQLLERLKDSSKVRPQDVDHWLVGLLRNRFASEQAWKWLRDNWPWIVKTFYGDKSYDMFPRYAASSFNTRKLLKEYREFFEPLKTQLSLKRNIELGVEELANRVEWLEADLPNIQKFLSKQ